MAQVVFELTEIRAELARTREMSGTALDAAVSAVSALQIVMPLLRGLALSDDERLAFRQADAEVKQAAEKLLNVMLSVG